MSNQNFNYTTICWYCGVIFQNNKSTAKFCHSTHRSFYGKYGSDISQTIRDRSGEYFNVDEILSEVYRHSATLKDYSEYWSIGYLEHTLLDVFGYFGPLPTGSSLLVVGSFLISRMKDHAIDSEEFYAVKPITRLTREEKARELFVKYNDCLLFSEVGPNTESAIGE